MIDFEDIGRQVAQRLGGAWHYRKANYGTVEFENGSYLALLILPNPKVQKNREVYYSKEGRARRELEKERAVEVGDTLRVDVLINYPGNRRSDYAYFLSRIDDNEEFQIKRLCDFTKIFIS